MKQLKNIKSIEDTITFTDNTLKKIIQKLLKVRKSFIPLNRLSQIKELEIKEVEISTLEGLQHLNNLTKLTIENCKINDINVLSLLKEHLTSLAIYESIIADFSPISELSRLATLEIANCNVGNFEILKDLTKLEELTIISDTISDITPLKYMNELRMLCLYENNISDIKVLKELPNLKQLYLYFNALDTTKFCTTMLIISDLEKKGCSVEYAGQKYVYIKPDLPILKDNGEFIKCYDSVALYSIPNFSGLYFFFDSDFQPLYIGKSSHLLDRIKAHLNGNSNMNDVKQYFYYVKFILIKDAEELETYETFYINTIQPKLNTEKTFTYNSSRLSFKYLYGEKWDKF